VGQLLEAALAQQAVSQSHEAGLGLQGEAEVEVGAGAEAGAGLTQGETEADLEKDLRGVESRARQCRTEDVTRGIERSLNQTSVSECLDSACTPLSGSSRRSLEGLEHWRKPRWFWMDTPAAAEDLPLCTLKTLSLPRMPERR